MAKERIIEAKPETKVCMGAKGHILIRQQDALGNDPDVVALDYQDVPQIIEWLKELYEERRLTPDEEFDDEAAADPKVFSVAE